MTGNTVLRAPRLILAATLLVGGLCVSSAPAFGQACDDATLQNWQDDADATACACFIPGEEAGAVFEAPAEDYPIEVMAVGILWISQFGGAPDSLEQAIHLYAGGLPDPGTAVATLAGPLLVDGVFNEFNLEDRIALANAIGRVEEMGEGGMAGLCQELSAMVKRRLEEAKRNHQSSAAQQLSECFNSMKTTLEDIREITERSALACDRMHLIRERMNELGDFVQVPE